MLAFAMSTYPIAGFGAILAGMASDKLFNANRHIPTLIYGIANIAGFALMFWGPQKPCYGCHCIKYDWLCQ